MLDVIPDMRDALWEADENELIEVFDARDVCATFTKPTRRLELAATVTPELVASHEKNDHPRGRSLNSGIAGAGFGSISDLVVPTEYTADPPSKARQRRRRQGGR